MKLSHIASASLLAAVIGACSSSPPDQGFSNPGSSSGSSGSGSGSTSSGSGSSSGSSGSSSGTVGTFGDDGGGSVPTTPGTTAGCPTGDNCGVACAFDDSTDHDGDGFSGADGDCNDCDPNTNPGAFDVPKDGIDEDCDGIPDDEPTGCDTNAVLDSTDPLNAALAMDLCRTTTASATGKQRTWGVVAGTYVSPDGSDNCTPENGGAAGSCVGNTNFPLGHGNLTKLGTNVPLNGGTHMFALSSGTARDPTDPGYVGVDTGSCDGVGGFDKGFTVTPASGYPAPAPACPGVTAGQSHDGAALRLVIRVPTNAQSFTINENFFTPEFPTWVCTEYNDAFVLEMAPAPTGASTGGNVAVDSAGNPISVNNALLQVCTAQTANGKAYTCPLGDSSLASTGFDGHAATGWLQTQVSIDPSLKGQDITLLFALWDSGDGCLDSTTLIDSFQWSTQPGQPQGPVTQPSPTQ